MSTAQKETKIDLFKIEEKLKPWIAFQNGVIGVLSFSFALACISLKGPISVIASTLSLFIIVSLSSIEAPQTSTALRILREKQNKTKHDHETLEFAQKKFPSNFRYMSFNIGFGALSLTWIYFIAIALIPEIQKAAKTLT